MYESARIVVFDTILNQVTDGKGEFDFVDFHRHRSEALHYQLYFLLLGNRLQALQNQLNQLIQIHRSNVEIRTGLIHTNQGQQVIDDLGLTVNFVGDITHEFLIEFNRNTIAHGVNGIRQYLHGSKWRLQLVGDVGYELLAGLIHLIHTVCIGIEFIRKFMKLRKAFRLQFLMGTGLMHLTDISCHLTNRGRNTSGENQRQNGNHNHGNQHNDDTDGTIEFHIGLQCTGGFVHQEYAVNHGRIARVRNGNGHRNTMAVGIIIRAEASSCTLDCVLPDDGTAIIHVVCVFYHLHVGINDHDTAGINIP